MCKVALKLLSYSNSSFAIMFTGSKDCVFYKPVDCVTCVFS